MEKPKLRKFAFEESHDKENTLTKSLDKERKIEANQQFARRKKISIHL